MYYHVRITTKSNHYNDEVKLDLSEERLHSQFIIPYENSESIIINGKAIPLNDIERIKITKSEYDSSQFQSIRMMLFVRRQLFLHEGKSPLDGYFPPEGKDVTDDFIRGPPGYKKEKLRENKISKVQSNQIFVVHGHDEEMKQAVARTLEKLDLKPIILHEQVNLGKTIIEKFESCSENVSFAIVLLSPDDIGYNKDQSPGSAMFRARQNVILELGYFMGKLGRKNVFVFIEKRATLNCPQIF
ncbi:TIR domain-containing protein [Methanosarcina mazei]|uniref:TIR domain-containing protein n=1 Tax=Methanosarcina mazei TaxID=2209 RepID=UPI0006989F9C|nr:nucleotide-binding protein [Methanosarcina mazei]